MDIALPRSAWKERSEGVRSLENWLICWILLPNIGYWLLWVIGGPPRAFPIFVTGLIGLLTHRASFPVKYVAFVVAMIFSALCFISALFNLSILSLLTSLKFALELKPSASIEYIICGAAVVTMLGIAWHLLKKSTILVNPGRLIAALALTIIAASADKAMSQGNRGSYKRVAEPGAEFTSAVGKSGLAGLATGERHVVMIMVEAMGQPTDPALRRKLVDIWARPEVRARYQVTSGETLFYGSTTGGEMRELCGRWGDYPEVLAAKDAGCLPARLAAKGYQTQAWHSFKGSFFDRDTWYPNIGFQTSRFGDQLMDAGAQWCPGVFPGACDRDVPRQLGAKLKSSREPQFLYWLTVNSHLPVLRNAKLHTEACDRFDARLDADYPMACRMFQLFDETGAALAREITAADFPDADILIVGDHIPPFFDRRHREQFAPDRVPWVLLHPKPNAATDKAPRPRFAAR